MKKVTKKAQSGGSLGSIYTGNDYSKSPAVTNARATAAKGKANLDKVAKAASDSKKAAITKAKSSKK